MQKINPWLQERLPARAYGLISPPLRYIIETISGQRAEVKSQLLTIPNLEMVSLPADRFLAVTAPPEMLPMIEAIPAVRKISADTLVWIRSPIPFLGIPSPAESIGIPTKFDPYLGEVRLSKVEIECGLVDGLAGLPLKGIASLEEKVYTTDAVRKLLGIPAESEITTKVAILDTGGIKFPHPLMRLDSKVELISLVPGEAPLDGMSHGSWCQAAAFGDNFTHPRWGRCEGMAHPEEQAHFKVLSNLGFGMTDFILDGIWKAFEWGAKVISMSLGGPLQGCLPAGTAIRTQTGFKPIENIEVGELVIAADGKFHKVTNRFSNGIRPLVRLITDRREVVATANHKFLALKETDLGWFPLEHIKAGDLVVTYGATKRGLNMRGRSLKLPKPILPDTRARTTNILCPKETSEDLLWMFGLWLGDGGVCIRATTWPYKSRGIRKTRKGMALGKGKVSFSIPANDASRPALVNAIQKVFGILPSYDESLVSVNSIILARWWKELEFSGEQHERTIPSWIYTLPRDEILAFLGGLVDADGHIRQGNYELTSVSRRLLEEVRNLCLWICIETSNIWEKKMSGYSTRSTYKMGFYSSELKTKGKIITGMKLKRRNFRYGYHYPIIRPPLRFERVKKVEQLPLSLPVFDLTVAREHSFIANGVLVHNSVIDDDPICRLINDLSQKGVIFCVAAGNEGPRDSSIGSPGAAPGCLCVGSWGITRNALSGFSSKGPSGEWYQEHQDAWESDLAKIGEDLMKPDCVCYGGDDLAKEKLLSAGIGWYAPITDPVPGFSLMMGTSMATPVAAGAIAIAYDRGIIKSAAELKQKLKESWDKPKSSEMGFGLLTFDRLLL